MNKAILFISLISMNASADIFVPAEGFGDAYVQNLGVNSLVYVSGDAAEVLFNSLKAPVETHEGSTQQTKSKPGISCTKTDAEFDCRIAVKN